MDEKEWLSTTNAHAMMVYLTASWPVDKVKAGWSRTVLDGRITERKLRLFCYAWQQQSGVEPMHEFLEDETPLSVQAMHGTVARWAVYITGIPNEGLLLKPVNQADLLRDIVGNPFVKPYMVVKRRPIGGDRYHLEKSDGSVITIGEQGSYKYFDRDWLTPTVLSLAQAAYADCGHKCEKCNGSGTYSVLVTNPVLSAANSYSPLTTYSEWRGCQSCGGDHNNKGTGTINTGILDPDRLLVLSDSLEEVGCDNVDVLQHLRGRECCPRCHSTGSVDKVSFQQSPGCSHKGPGKHSPTSTLVLCEECCGEKWIPKRGSCVRGCWVLDLLLGRS